MRFLRRLCGRLAFATYETFNNLKEGACDCYNIDNDSEQNDQRNKQDSERYRNKGLKDPPPTRFRIHKSILKP